MPAIHFEAHLQSLFRREQKLYQKLIRPSQLSCTVAQLAGPNHSYRALCVLERALPTEAAQLAGPNHSYRALCVLERALLTEAAQLNHSYRARQSTLCSREGSTN